MTKEIEKVKAEIKVLEKKLAFLEELEKTKTPCEEAFKRVYGNYPSSSDKSVFWTDSDEDIWIAFQQGYEAAQSKAVPAEEVEDKYEKYGGFSYFTDDVIDNVIEKWKQDPPSFLRFEMSNTLEQLITDWWCDTFTSKSNLSMEECIADLCEKVEEWLPDEQNSEGTQRIETEISVDTHNELLQKIKSKLRNKK